jgi:hypothetical protein
MRTEIVDVDYSAQLKPPYKWRTFAVRANGNKIILDNGEGSWVEAFLNAQDWRKLILIKNILDFSSKTPNVASTILRNVKLMF